MKLIAKIFSVFTLTLTIICAIEAAILVIPKIFGVFPYIITSDSMSPKIPAGSVAYITTNDRDVEIGDIIAYVITTEENIELGDGRQMAAGSGAKVTHRIIDYYRPYEGADPVEGWYVTQGDQNEYPDANPVSVDQIIGTYVLHIPVLGFVLSALGRKGIILIIIGLFVLNIASILLSTAANTDDEDEEKAEDTPNDNNLAEEGGH